VRVLAVGAHPDDVEFLCAGTLVKCVARGDEVTIAVATNGEVGSSTLAKHEIAAIRKKEAEASASLLGARLIWMGFPDEFLFSDAATRTRFIDVLREANPDFVIAHSPGDYHPDHRISGEIITDARILSTIRNIVTEHPPCAKIPHVYYMDTLGGVDFAPELFVDITREIETKKAMLLKHESQMGFLKDLYGISSVEFMESMAKARGIQSGCRYAEAFRSLRTWPVTAPRSLLP